MWRSYPLRIGLPQTNARQLAEPRMLMEAGNVFWWALGEAIGRPVSALRTAAGQPVYATIYFIDEQFPPDRTLGTFHLDDQLRMLVDVRSLSSLSMEGRVVFDREDRLAVADDAWWERPAPHPTIRFGSVFAAVDATGRLRPIRPANADASQLAPLALEAALSRHSREAEQTGRLALIPEDWAGLDADGAPITVDYTIDPDRDTNAAGLVYFANYVSMLECGERAALATADGGAGVDLASRQVLARRIAYFGTARPDDRVTVAVSRFRSPAQPDRVGLRYRLTRAADATLLCLSEAIFAVRPADASTSASHGATASTQPRDR
jgi:probable biosynthetic protein (TIGR04098 family)